jgi:C1A family cysteine protease
VALICLGSTSVRAQDVPIAFDLRSVTIGSSVQAWVPTIQNQGTAEDCWTFASATAIESNLLMNGLLAGSTTPPPMQISSWHLSTHNGAPDQLIAADAFSNTLSNWGGNMFQTLGYVTRGSGTWQIPNAPKGADAGNFIQVMSGGPVLISQNPLNVFPESIVVGNPQSPSDPNGYPANLSPLIPPAGQPLAFKVTAMTFYDQGFSNNVALPTASGTVTIDSVEYNTYVFNQGANDPQVGVIKSAMLNNGAVTTYMNANGDFHTVPGTGVNTIQYFNGKTATGYSDHAVTIIGWNDTYTMTDPKTSVTYTGAWLVQNSWGTTGWNNSDGTFWAPYDDAVIGRSGVTTFQLAPMAGQSQTVIQNELGPMDYSGNYQAVSGTPPAWDASVTGMATATESVAASVLTPQEDGLLIALGLATQISGVQVNVRIFDAWSGGPSNLLSQQSFLLNGIGYYQADLSQALSLSANDSFVVELSYVDPLTGLGIADALPITIGGSGLNGYGVVDSGLSFTFDGATWKDLATVDYTAYYSGVPDPAQGGILFVKGITAIPEPSTWILLVLSAGILVLVIRRRKGSAI